MLTCLSMQLSWCARMQATAKSSSFPRPHRKYAGTCDGGQIVKTKRQQLVRPFLQFHAYELAPGTQFVALGSTCTICTRNCKSILGKPRDHQAPARRLLAMTPPGEVCACIMLIYAKRLSTIKYLPYLAAFSPGQRIMHQGHVFLLSCMQSIAVGERKLQMPPRDIVCWVPPWAHTNKDYAANLCCAWYLLRRPGSSSTAMTTSCIGQITLGKKPGSD